MRVSMKVKGIKKPYLNKQDIISFIDDVSEDMQQSTIENAPEDTSTLKNHGIEKAKIDASIAGYKVYLDTDAVRANYPDERQKKRPDGGYYPYYQEYGWNGRPGKHYFKQSFDEVEFESENKIKTSAKDFIILK